LSLDQHQYPKSGIADRNITTPTQIARSFIHQSSHVPSWIFFISLLSSTILLMSSDSISSDLPTAATPEQESGPSDVDLPTPPQQLEALLTEVSALSNLALDIVQRSIDLDGQFSALLAFFQRSPHLR
jgi:hypothetical protein